MTARESLGELRYGCNLSSHDSPSRDLANHDSESRATIAWHVYDPHADVKITARDRPHWDQACALTFVTIRLADSMPKPVIERWKREQETWLVRNHLTGETIDSMLAYGKVPENIRRSFLKFRNQRWHENLDNCHGGCELRRHEFAMLVANCILKFDGDRYDCERIVVMPNHVHLLIQMRPGWALRKQCENWTRFSARQINAALSRRGEFWAEPFDHIVRSLAQFQYFRHYIVENPRQARLSIGDYLLWIRDTGFTSVDEALRHAPSSHDSPSRDCPSSHDSPSREERKHQDSC